MPTPYDIARKGDAPVRAPFVTDTPRRTAAESQHGDATDARQILRRLLGWNLDENERNSIRQALEVIDRIDSRAIRTMRDDWTAANLPS